MPSNQQPQGGATLWHLCWQSAQGCDLFVDTSLYVRVRTRLIEAHRRPGRMLVDYVLLPTEIHAIVDLPPEDSAGAIAREVGNIVARWVRHARLVRGPVFAGPYRAHRIESLEGLLGELRMLAWRPALLGHCRTPAHYRHSSLRTVLGLTPAQGFDARPLLGLFGTSVVQARAEMRRLVGKRPSDRDARQWELAHGLALAVASVGSQPAMAMEVRSGAAAALIAAGGPRGVEGALQLLERWVGVKLAVAGEMEQPGAQRALAVRTRALVACLAVEHRLCSASSVARYFGRAKATLSEQMAACRHRAEDRGIVRTPVGRIVDEGLALPPRSGGAATASG